jgi:hypothetical protein
MTGCLLDSQGDYMFGLGLYMVSRHTQRWGVHGLTATPCCNKMNHDAFSFSIFRDFYSPGNANRRIGLLPANQV